ncbi:calcium-binding protein [Novosphingobium sp. PASSN1]|uniref:calcium-binding protein n=1 Tax=Novosphingobium sp. PASSN1 TaxID=2015561 RepID=UPI000BCFC137|nr:calcium-binding protein [Novosphingobium sp. PASSN1]OYU36514.1 MAG: hypothetical protein CFE35_04345 [Novosphingobium sp. PASSN1]
MAVIKGTINADTLNGTAEPDQITGLAGADTLKGLGGNDTLDGGTGDDQMYGGAGDDTFLVDSTGDKLFELTGEGIDLVKASVSFSLAAFIENLALQGTAAINGAGNSAANRLTGNGAANVLKGLGGNDLLDGGAGGDTMYGGTDNDTYIVDSTADKVIELTGEGTDLVQSSISFTLGANVEKLLLTGSGGNTGIGNTLGNALTGNGANNTLKGLAGNDVLVGGAGNDVLVGGTGMDTMTGGTGNDKFAFDDGDFASKTSIGADVIVDFTAGDKIDLGLVDAVSSSTPYNQPGDQSFVFVGHNRFMNEMGRQLRYDVVGGNTYVYGNVNGDTTADFCIKILGSHTLTSSDFVL